MDKSIHDVFLLGSRIVINSIPHELKEVMICGTSEALYTVLKCVAEKEIVFFGMDIEARRPCALSADQLEFYHTTHSLHHIRMVGKGVKVDAIDFKSENLAGDYGELSRRSFEQNIQLQMHSYLSIRDIEYDLVWYSFLQYNLGNSLLVCVPENVMLEELAGQELYEEVDFTIHGSEYDIKDHGMIVRIEKTGSNFLLYIQPYSMEMMQSSSIGKTSFEKIRNPFVIMDFILNHSDSGITGIKYPNSDLKYTHNYIIVGELRNVCIEIKDCVIGTVSVGNQVETSNKFYEELSAAGLTEKNSTLVWVNVKADSLYMAFKSGRRSMTAAAEFLSFMFKNDMYDDWFGTVGHKEGTWDIRYHNPQINLGTIFYIEDCVTGEALTLTDENLKSPQIMKVGDSAGHLFDYDWVEQFFCRFQIEDKKILRLKYALRWIVQAWDTEDVYDRVIYCSMALEFILNGEKGKNIFDEYADIAGRDRFTKAERKQLINTLLDQMEIKEMDGFTDDVIEKLNTSVRNMVRNTLSGASFSTKLDSLVERLSIPVSDEEKELLRNSRKIRNDLIHGRKMTTITTLEIKKLCGVTSRILMYKIMAELGNE